MTVETSLDELLTLIQKLMNIVIHSTIHLSYLKVTDYFTEIMCLGLQMKTTQDHSLSRRQIPNPVTVIATLVACHELEL